MFIDAFFSICFCNVFSHVTVQVVVSFEKVLTHFSDSFVAGTLLPPSGEDKFLNFCLPPFH